MERTQKSRVFLSSALEGSEDLRPVIIDFFEKNGYSPVYFGDKCSGRLTGRPGIVEQCLDGVRQSDALLLIVDKRYGGDNQKDDEGNSISLTELEFLEANKRNIYTYIFCRKEVWIVHKVWETNPHMNFYFDERYDHPEKLMTFLAKLKKRYIIPQFDNSKDLEKTLYDRIELSVGLLKSPTSLTDENENLEASP